MAENSKIEWTHHTFNPWRGCTKVSAGCANCYAETLSHRNPKTLGVWGDKGTRVVASESYWREPLKWNRLAKQEGERHRVFCASLADIFEDREELDQPRQRLFDLILATPDLDWLLLTKRPDVMAAFLTGSDAGLNSGVSIAHTWGDGWPNVWLGVSVEDQATMKARGPILLSIPAIVHFLSVEPMLGPIDAGDYLHFYHGNRPRSKQWPCKKRIGWVIVGGESGPGARPMHPEWVQSMRDQCAQASVPFFFKQWGEWAPNDVCAAPATDWVPIGADKALSHIHVWPGRDEVSYRIGKKSAGRVLDGRLWDGFPEKSQDVPT